MKVYKSKIGAGLIIPLTLLLLVVGILMVYQETWPGVAIVLLVSLLVGHLFMTTYYKIDGATLQIKSGLFFHKSLNIASIRKISKTRNPISSPALSLDRLELIYNRFDSVLISPEDERGFIQALTAVKPDIEVILKT